MMFYRIIVCMGLAAFVAGIGFDSDVVVLRAVRGRDARLPCGQGKVFLDGPDSYIIWLKNDKEYLYRYPSEDSELKFIAQNQLYGVACESAFCHDETSLLLKHVGDEDTGIYRCRIHYQASPSYDYVIDLRLVDSPGTPKIFNENGEEIKGYVGPISLGSDLHLFCEINDDQPDTLLYWRRNGVTIERTHTVRGTLLRAETGFSNATRDDLDAHYECIAQNADVTEPLTASVVVKMYLPPLHVEIRLNNNFDFEAGQPRVVDCVVVGCVPPPAITWHLGNNLLRSTVHKELHDGNYTVSSLTLAPSLHENKRELVCRAHNSHLPTSVFQDKVTIIVGHRPICLTNREETVGAIFTETETVTCVVESSPRPMQFSWTFSDSRTLYTSVKAVPGHHNRYSSTLTWMPRKSDVGLLLCRAMNAFGEQKRPCSYTITHGGPPHTPECIVLRSYPNNARVQCKKGWDGGRLQIVHLELLNADGTVFQNVSNGAGNFLLPDIDSDKNLTALIYASSPRGRSATKTLRLQNITPLSAPVVIDDVPVRSWMRWIEVMGGTIGVIAAGAVSVICIKLLMAKRDNSEINPDLVPRSDGSFHREPDFTREERLLGTTNITVNQIPPCQNQYSSTPVSSCRVLVGCGALPTAPDTFPANQHTYYV